MNKHISDGKVVQAMSALTIAVRQRFENGLQ
jgi:hypothetical protein